MAGAGHGGGSRGGTPRETIVILAPRRMWDELVARLSDLAVPKCFETPAELEAWRLGELHHSPIYIHVMSALEEIGCGDVPLAPRLKRVFRRLSERDAVPPLEELLDHLSKRTFYLAWKAQLTESPRKFFERVKTRHALWLIEHAGLSAQEAAFRAGFSDPRSFYRARRRLVSDKTK